MLLFQLTQTTCDVIMYQAPGFKCAHSSFGGIKIIASLLTTKVPHHPFQIFRSAPNLLYSFDVLK